MLRVNIAMFGNAYLVCFACVVVLTPTKYPILIIFRYDTQIYTNESQPIIWAIGPVNSKVSLLLFHLYQSVTHKLKLNQTMAKRSINATWCFECTTFGV